MIDRRAETSGRKVEILHSWKSIANYLNRSVRTVIRWEENENLPVRRHKHLKNNSIYAYTGELERWLGEREEIKLKQPIENISKNNPLNKDNKTPVIFQGIIRWLNKKQKTV